MTQYQQDGARCGSCGGTGQWRGRGANTGRVGKCFRCAGKGYQSSGDRARNATYDARVARVPVPSLEPVPEMSLGGDHWALDDAGPWWDGDSSR